MPREQRLELCDRNPQFPPQLDGGNLPASGCLVCAIPAEAENDSRFRNREDCALQ